MLQREFDNIILEWSNKWNVEFDLSGYALVQFSVGQEAVVLGHTVNMVDIPDCI